VLILVVTRCQVRSPACFIAQVPLGINEHLICVIGDTGV
jgi:hypothetical protein